MPNPEMQSLVFNAATAVGPSPTLNVSKEAYAWWVLTVHATNAQVQLEVSEDGLAFYPALAQLPSTNPLSLVTGSGYILYYGTTSYIRANILNISQGSVTAVLQGYPWNYLNAPVTVQAQVGLTGGFSPNPLQPGPQSEQVLPFGSLSVPRISSLGSLYTTHLGGRFAAAVKEGRVFFAAHQAVQALSVNSTTATGLIITNPLDSAVVVELLELQAAIASLPAGQSSLVLTGSSFNKTSAVSHTTPMKVQNALLGSDVVGYAKVDSAATLPAVEVIRVVGAGTAATVAGSTAFPPFVEDELEGLISLMPGSYISLQSVVTAISIWGSVCWRETPLNVA